MATQVDIANGALANMGEELIVSFDDTSKAAQLVKNRYNIVRKEILRRHPWKSVSDRQRLAVQTAKPVFGRLFRHSLPPRTLRIWRVLDLQGIGTSPESLCLDESWKREGDVIISNSNDIGIEFVKDESNTQRFDDMLAQVISAKLAVDISYAITQDLDLKKHLFSEFIEILAKAKSVDAKEEAPRELRADSWITQSRLIHPVPAIPGLQ